MYILPAIDLMDGKCVRLIQGDYHKQMVYRDNPVDQAAEFRQAGAQWLHVVDLDGAKIGKSVNADTIAAIVNADLGLKVEVGGGIRDEDSIKRMLNAGVDRVIIGTRAVNDFGWFTQMVEKYPNKLVLGLDARGSKVAIEGWTQEGSHSLLEFAKQAAHMPIAAIIYTDISKDGMMAGPNFERTGELAAAVSVPVIASGGVTTLEDIKKLAPLQVEGAIVGRALYEGTLDLKDAIAAAGR
ncbi:1-(5-phosphoribosyl)-5-[(5-phosphoribosylamino)methylideneamino] imidazole-4-carboxamide isomerase [Anaerohalosphaera lusitana]|uniref:1-(5-phosphoribosyl)-5-[(5-phosphoribosylamino)methylideneamino] imidazole-4-carboxamide isomerase n=1 Tax=Anaerohalosphaera lusitana TaxID=1936003 RepID=A0A1U9NR52_9BACT|nr:1-(5-phosphoribosyl)-5-[(5-phosphoribosylamino)methylideneamino]imidazole-4-carboxamide isomerase [Anaerohalosphaera lusitana]AQT70224.1 1-(5-phosphoribosyl)-5-[(5-phosphoribosylamino)methylideneamino] imidazole-4-carboxamide isomerase [Anaerohalosphaera lusitana]